MFPNFLIVFFPFILTHSPLNNWNLRSSQILFIYLLAAFNTKQGYYVEYFNPEFNDEKGIMFSPLLIVQSRGVTLWSEGNNVENGCKPWMKWGFVYIADAYKRRRKNQPSLIVIISTFIEAVCHLFSLPSLFLSIMNDVIPSIYYNTRCTLSQFIPSKSKILFAIWRHPFFFPSG